MQKHTHTHTHTHHAWFLPNFWSQFGKYMYYHTTIVQVRVISSFHMHYSELPLLTQTKVSTYPLTL